MPVFLTKRNRSVTELMDDPGCDPQLLTNTYKQFNTINRLLGGWAGIYKKRLHPVLQPAGRTAKILDIGCGGGDLLRRLHKLSEKDRLDVQFTGIDPDPRAVQFAVENSDTNQIRFLNISSGELAKSGEAFDVVISNHLIHHLSDSELTAVCRDAEILAEKLVLFNDIERSDVAYAAFRSLSPLFFRNSFISEDGCTSIRRSYRRDELQAALPANWQVKRLFPFRLLALFEK